MLIIALVLALLAMTMFLARWATTQFTSWTDLGLAVISGSLAAFVAHFLEETGKI